MVFYNALILVCLAVLFQYALESLLGNRDALTPYISSLAEMKFIISVSKYEHKSCHLLFPSLLLYLLITPGADENSDREHMRENLGKKES